MHLGVRFRRPATWSWSAPPLWDGGRGAAMLFQAGPGGDWQEVARLTVARAGEQPRFGSSTALSGGAALISAPGEGEGAGAVYLFTRDASGTWQQRARVQADEGSNGFGANVALGDGVALVSTPGGRDASSQVYTFGVDRAAGELTPAGELEPPGDLGDFNGFGRSLALRGSLALVGAPGAADASGRVLAYRHDEASGEWVPDGALSPFDMPARGQFGAAVTVYGNDVWVGAPGAKQRRGQCIPV